MIKINLLPHKKVKALDKNIVKLRMIIFATTVVLALVLVYLSFALIAKRYELTQHLAQTGAELGAMKKRVKDVENYEKSRIDVEAKIGIIRDLDNRKIPMTPMLNAINEATTQDVWVTGVQVTGTSINLDGKTRDTKKNAQAFADKLKSSPAFVDVSLGDIKEVSSQDRSIYTFQITGKLAGYPESAKPLDAQQAAPSAVAAKAVEANPQAAQAKAPEAAPAPVPGTTKAATAKAPVKALVPVVKNLSAADSHQKFSSMTKTLLFMLVPVTLAILFFYFVYRPMRESEKLSKSTGNLLLVFVALLVPLSGFAFYRRVAVEMQPPPAVVIKIGAPIKRTGGAAPQPAKPAPAQKSTPAVKEGSK